MLRDSLPENGNGASFQNVVPL